MSPLNFSDAEHIKRVVVDPVVVGVEEKLKGLLAAMEMRIRAVEERENATAAHLIRMEERLDEVERFKARALRWASYAGGCVGATWSTVMVLTKEKFLGFSKRLFGIH